MRIFPTLLVLLLVAWLPVCAATASTSYQYTGNNFSSFVDGATATGTYTTTSDFVSVTMTFAELLAPNLASVEATPVSFMAYDGRQTINQSNTTHTISDDFTTDELGDIVGSTFFLHY